MFLLNLLGQNFKLLAVGEVETPAGIGVPVVRIGAGGLKDRDGFVAARLGRDVLYLVRPDQHVAARFKAPTYEAVAQGIRRAGGLHQVSARVSG